MSTIVEALASVPAVTADHRVTRTELVRPAMCGPNSSFAGRIGDWTWDAVSALCGTDVLRATDAHGNPAYLSFYYYRIRGSSRFHLHSPRFGDRLDVTTAVFGLSPESVYTVHRIVPAGMARASGARPLALEVENLNRWIVRRRPGTNADLASAAPPDFRFRHLPALPDAASPRAACKRARSRLSFLDRATGRFRQRGSHAASTYRIDPTRDLNGVGLVYFASYFAILDRALWQYWRAAGRSQASFLDRVVTDQRVCFTGNADAEDEVDATVRHWRTDVPGDESFDIVLTSRGRTIAVCSLDVTEPVP